MNTEKIFGIIDQKWDDHLAYIQSYIRQPSVSGSGYGIHEMAGKLVEEFKALGCADVRLVETKGWPVVYAYYDAGAPKTMLLYGMYDVQPVVDVDVPVEDEEKFWKETWVSDPWAARVVKPDEYIPKLAAKNQPLDNLGDLVIGRGICNQKGPLAAAMNVLFTIRDAEGKLPVNVKFVIEGEEEMNSQNLPYAVDLLRDELKTCDFCYFPHFGQDMTGKVKQFLGTKGIINIKLSLTGGDWGAPAARAIHGANAIWMDNPVWKMVHILKTLKDENEHVLIDGFYDGVAGPLEGDEELVDQLAEVWNPAETLKTEGVARFKLGMTDKKEILHRYFFQPELNIDGIEGGFYGRGSKTFLPNSVSVNMDIRTVPNLEPDDLIAKMRRHFEKIGVADMVEFKATYGYNWARAKIGEPAVQSLITAIQTLGYEVEPWVTLAGSAPFSLFNSMLGIPCAFGGLGHGGRVHNPNEYATVKGLKDCEKCMVLFLENISR